MQAWLAVPALTVVLGATVIAVWFAIWGPDVARGPLRALQSWPYLYAALAVVTALIGYAYARTARQLSATRLAVFALASIVGEFVALLVFGRLLADELADPVVAVSIWAVATGVIVQPLALFVGGVIAMRRRR